jgi:hypothetical protein
MRQMDFLKAILTPGPVSLKEKRRMGDVKVTG